MNIRQVSLFSVVLALLLAGCGNGARGTLSPPPSTLAVPAEGVPASPTRTVTPTRVPITFEPITPEPTWTPLFRAAEISAADYGQELTLYLGDVFVLHRADVDQGPLEIDDPNVLQFITDPNSDVVTLKAIGLGEAMVSYTVVILCPPPGPGCEPPLWEMYVFVTVVDD
jgi:hypothetical protein